MLALDVAMSIIHPTMPKYYEVTVTVHKTPNGAASFFIEPPIEFLSDEKRDELIEIIRQMISDRMGIGEDSELELAITHNLPDGSGTVGHARFSGLQLTNGAMVLQQALKQGLNGKIT